MKSLPNYLDIKQINILIERSKNFEFHDDEESFQEIKKSLKSISKDLFKKEHNFIIMKETHQYTINLCGEFDLYSYDKIKNSDVIMEYDNEIDMTKEEVKKVLKNHLYNIDYEYTISTMIQLSVLEKLVKQEVNNT